MRDNILVLQVTYYHCVHMCKDANLCGSLWCTTNADLQVNKVKHCCDML